MSAAKGSAREDVLRGIWENNPVFGQFLGLCPALAVTNAVANGIAMGLAFTFVLLGSSIMISSLRKVIPSQVRITAYILIIATFVTIVDLVMAAVVPEIHKTMAAFIALIVVNCIILGRQEAFASKNTVGRSIADAVGNGIGFTGTMVMLSAVREVLGNGTFLGFHLFGPNFEPWVIMILPPGGFFALGFYLLAFGWWKERAKKRAAMSPIRRWPHDVDLTREPAAREALV